MVSACIMTLHEQIYQLHWPAVPPSFLADCVRSHKERKNSLHSKSGQGITTQRGSLCNLVFPCVPCPSPSPPSQLIYTLSPAALQPAGAVQLWLPPSTSCSHPSVSATTAAGPTSTSADPWGGASPPAPLVKQVRVARLGGFRLIGLHDEERHLHHQRQRQAQHAQQPRLREEGVGNEWQGPGLWASLACAMCTCAACLIALVTRAPCSLDLGIRELFLDDKRLCVQAEAQQQLHPGRRATAQS